MALLKLPKVKQRAPYDCGEAAARCAFAYFNLEYPDLTAAGWPNPIDGLDPRVLEAVFRVAGLNVQAGEMTLEDLKHHAANDRPVLALIRLGKDGHWVVSRGVSRNRVYVMDPAGVAGAYSSAEWHERWRDICRGGHVFYQFGIAVGP